MLHITFSKYDCIIVHKAYHLFTCTCVSINSFHSHSHSHSHIGCYDKRRIRCMKKDIIRLCIIMQNSLNCINIVSITCFLFNRRSTDVSQKLL